MSKRKSTSRSHSQIASGPILSPFQVQSWKSPRFWKDLHFSLLSVLSEGVLLLQRGVRAVFGNVVLTLDNRCSWLFLSGCAHCWPTPRWPVLGRPINLERTLKKVGMEFISLLLGRLFQHGSLPQACASVVDFFLAFVREFTVFWIPKTQKNQWKW